MNSDQLIERYGYCIIDFDATTGRELDPIATQYNIVVMCLAGSASVEANMQVINIEQGDCLNLANVIFMRSISMSEDFKARILVTSRGFSLEATVGIPTEYMEHVFLNPVTKTETEIERQLLKNSFENLILLQQQPLLVKHYEVAASFFRNIVIVIAQIEMRRSGGAVVTHFSQADVYFRQFIDLIYAHVDQEHEVGFYGNKMNISPKYLSAISKQKCGHNAKDVISSFLVAHIKRDILLSGKPIKTIAYDYGFADQSSLAKFFNKMTGQSPTLFKQQNS